MTKARYSRPEPVIPGHDRDPGPWIPDHVGDGQPHVIPGRDRESMPLAL